MIKNIELTDSGIEKFNKFFSDLAKDGVRIDAVMMEMLGIMEERARAGESMVYELGHQYTNTGNPELLRLDAEDFEIFEEPDA